MAVFVITIRLIKNLKSNTHIENEVSTGFEI